jgi:hypothetical protein
MHQQYHCRQVSIMTEYPFVYVCTRIDFGYPMAMLIEQVARDRAAGLDPKDAVSLPELYQELNAAQAVAHETGWMDEADQGREARVLRLPAPDGSVLRWAFAWQRAADGITIVVSPFPLPWLDAFTVTVR